MREYNKIGSGRKTIKCVAVIRNAAMMVCDKPIKHGVTITATSTSHRMRTAACVATIAINMMIEDTTIAGLAMVDRSDIAAPFGIITVEFASAVNLIAGEGWFSYQPSHKGTR